MVTLLMMLLVGKLGLLGWDVDGEVLSLNPLVCVFAFFASLNIHQKTKGAVLSKWQRASVGRVFSMGPSKSLFRSCVEQTT